MNILYVAEELDRSECACIVRIAKAGHQLKLLTQESVDTTPLEEAGISVARLPLAGRVDKRSIQGIQQELETGHYDVVHCLRNNRPLSNTLIANKKARVPLLAYRGTVGHVSRLNPGSWMTYLNPRIDCLSCLSNAVKRYLHRQGVPNRRLRTIYKGYDLNWHPQSQLQDLGAVGIPDDACVVCCVGKMRPVKGVPILIKALHHLPKESKVHLLLVGEVKDDGIEKEANHPAIKHRVHLVGFQANATDWTASSNIFVMPSLKREGLCRAVLESMSLGIPTIVSDVGGMPELVEHEVSGWVVPPNNPQALALAISELEHNETLRNRYIQAAKERIAGPFSIDRMVEELLDCYAQIRKP